MMKNNVNKCIKNIGLWFITFTYILCYSELCQLCLVILGLVFINTCLETSCAMQPALANKKHVFLVIFQIWKSFYQKKFLIFSNWLWFDMSIFASEYTCMFCSQLVQQNFPSAVRLRNNKIDVWSWPVHYGYLFF